TLLAVISRWRALERIACSQAAKGIILGTKGRPGKGLIQYAQERAGGGHGENEAAENVVKSRALHQRLHLLAAQETGIRVEFARFYDVPRYRVERIMLKNCEQTARPKNPFNVAYQRSSVGQSDVMKDADGERQVETAIGVRQVNSVVCGEIHVRHPLSRRGDAPA